MDFPGGAIKALQQAPRVWEHLGRIATAGEAGWERHFRNQVAVSLTNLGFPTEPALGTESADSPAVLDEASQAFYSEKGLPTGFAHGARPPGLARLRGTLEPPAGVQGATSAEATHSFLAGVWAQHFLEQLEANQPGARHTFEQIFQVEPGTPIKEAMERMRGLRHRLFDPARPRRSPTRQDQASRGPPQ